MPWGDWQFWVVTVIALGAVVAAWRYLVPRGTLGRKKKATKVGLTIGGEKPRA